MKHIQKLRKLILTLGILAGMSMTVFAEETTIRCEGTDGSINTMFPQNGIGRQRNRVGDNVSQLSGSSSRWGDVYFIAPEGKCFTKIEVIESYNNETINYGYQDCWTGWNGGRALTVKQEKYIIPFDETKKIIIDFTVDDLAIYNVTLNTNGGTVNDGNITTYTEFYGATLPTNVTRNGYTFEGWYDNAGLTGEPVTSIASDATGNKDYWAKWLEIITVTAKADPSTTGTYYATFYDSTKSYTADCEVYYATANADGRFTLEKAEGNVIKAGEGVILKATGENVTLTKTTTEANYDSLLTGSDTETTVENALVLSLGKNGVWFYKYSGTLGANKAYLAQ